MYLLIQARTEFNDFIIYTLQGSRFIRFSHSHISRLSVSDTAPHRLREFDAVGGGDIANTTGMLYSGVFLCGPRPCWALVAQQSTTPYPQLTCIDSQHIGSALLRDPCLWASSGYLRIHPYQTDGHIRGFAAFDNESCRNGFVYFNDDVYLFNTVESTYLQTSP